MRSRFLIRTSFLLAFAVCSLFLAAPQARAQFFGSTSFISATTIPQASRIQTTDLVKLLKGPASARPMVLQVGSHVMYQQAHIPGSQYAGPGANAGGLKLLTSTVASVPKDRFIVLYCGCCPWGHCPNVGPAYKRLHELGYTNVKVLYLADNFGDDWVNKGYPVVRGQ